MALTDIDVGEEGLKQFLTHCTDELQINPSSSGIAREGAHITQAWRNKRYPHHKVQYNHGTIEQLRPYITRGAPFVISFYYSDGYRRDMNTRTLKAEDYAEQDWRKKGIGSTLPITQRPFLKKVDAHAMTIQKIGNEYLAIDSIDTNETYHIP